MVEDTDKPSIALTVNNGDAKAIKDALIEEGIEVSELSEQPIQGLAFLAPVVLWVVGGVTYDVAKFVAKRGAKGLKQLVKKTQKKSGRPEEKTTVYLTDETTKTTAVLTSDLPEEAYEALAKIDLRKLPGLTLNWHDGKWQIDVPQKIKPGDDGF